MVNVDPADLHIVLDQRVLHSHIRPGIWDSDNRPGLANTRCEECAACERLFTALIDDEQESTALTRDQLVAIEALRQANQTLLETYVKTGSEDSGTAVRNFVLETAQAYRDFINDKAGA